MHQSPASFTSLFDEFATRLGATGGASVRATSLDDVVLLIRDVPGIDEDNPVWISQPADLAFPGLAGVLRETSVVHRLPGSPGEVRDTPLGIAVARIAIAETGSVLLQEPSLADRSVSLMTQRLIVLCPESTLVPSLDDAAPVLREIAQGGPSYATFVTGPSRTADIERELAIGVQGPGSLHIVFLPDQAD